MKRLDAYLPPLGAALLMLVIVLLTSATADGPIAPGNCWFKTWYPAIERHALAAAHPGMTER